MPKTEQSGLNKMIFKTAFIINIIQYVKFIVFVTI